MGAFLSKICSPVAEELGLAFQDYVKNWRANNVIKTMEKAEERVKEKYGNLEVSASPRIVNEVFEKSSWIDNEEVQSMWAGLLASSCSPGVADDRNLIFVNLLNQLTISEARLLNHLATQAEIGISPGGWIQCNKVLTFSVNELKAIMDIDDPHQIDLELDHMREAGLFQLDEGGFNPNYDTANFSLSAIALHLYAKCQGSPSPIEHFKLKP